MAEKNNANIGFERQIWDAACVLWEHIPAAEYRKVIVGLIFLRYISSAFDKHYQELLAGGDGFEDNSEPMKKKIYSLSKRRIRKNLLYISRLYFSSKRGPAISSALEM